jgi:hypothetical protein
MTGKQVLFNSSLKLFINEDYFLFQKLQFMLGGDYKLSQDLAQLPLDSGILVVTADTHWFVNYYMLPRRLYTYPEVTKDEDLKKVPKNWLLEKGINYILLYHIPNVRLLQVDKDGNIK